MKGFASFILKYKFTLAILLILAIFLRFYNIPKTHWFSRDQSQNLVDMHRIWVEKDLTLIGPINGDMTIIYPSLTFYMLLPFAVLGKFTPASPSYGTAFFGVLTFIILMYLAWKINKKLALPVSILAAIWYPLVESSRWAWNPHLLPFTSFLALLFLYKRGSLYKLLAGFMFGLSFHLHYLSVISFAVLGFFYSIYKFITIRFKHALVFGIGFLISILPFIYFDIKNPPGLFFGRFVNDNLFRRGIESGIAGFWSSFMNNAINSLSYMSHEGILAILTGSLILILIIFDLKNRNYKNFVFLLPSAVQLAAISYLPEYANRYFLLGLPFLFTWIIEKREQPALLFQKMIIWIMIAGSVLTVPVLLTTPTRYPTAYIVRSASDFIINKVDEKQLKNINIASLASPDRDPLSEVYRHMLLINDIEYRLENEYGLTDNLFVITNSDAHEVRNDPANVMNGFRSGELVDQKSINEKGWKIMLLNRD